MPTVLKAKDAGKVLKAFEASHLALWQMGAKRISQPFGSMSDWTSPGQSLTLRKHDGLVAVMSETRTRVTQKF